MLYEVITIYCRFSPCLARALRAKRDSLTPRGCGSRRAIGSFPFPRCSARSAARVITSYSIHYTKLYDNLAFIAVFGAISASLIETRFVHYDNFSHWAVVVKYMLATNRIPDAASAIIDFKSYPLGSSSFP